MAFLFHLLLFDQSLKVDNYYSPNHDSGIKWDDSDLNINWNIDVSDVNLSEKDKDLIAFKDFKSPFTY